MTVQLGVSNHPAKDEIERLWREGIRAAEINVWLEDHGFQTLNPQSLGRYGQRYWNEKIELHWDDDPVPKIHQAIDLIEGSQTGVVTSVSYKQKAYPSWQREHPEDVATTRDAKTTSVSVTVKPVPEFPFTRAEPTSISLEYGTIDGKISKPSGWKTGVFLPDMQIGYRRDGNELVATHDEVAIDLAHKIMLLLDEVEGIDLVVNAGDNLDLPAFSTHRSAPGYVQTTQYAINRTALEAQMQRALAPEAEIVWLQGNHEQRLINSLVDKMPALVGLTRADEDDPILSVPYLCRFGDYDIKYVESYPDGKFWVNDHFMFLHGDKHSSTLGMTARKQLANGVSVGYGHIHRRELLYDRRPVRNGTIPIFAGSPGSLCKITGQVPSTRTGIAASGKQLDSHAENWHQGIWVFRFEEGGDQRVFLEPVEFEGGFTFFRGQPLVGKDRIDV